jgi:hypothetical protein
MSAVMTEKLYYRRSLVFVIRITFRGAPEVAQHFFNRIVV